MCVLNHSVFLQSESDGSVVMKMEFGDEDAETGDSQAMGLAARLAKKVKKEPKEKGAERKELYYHVYDHLQLCSI